MRYNLNKHKILKALSEKLASGMGTDGKAKSDISVSKKEIINLIGKDKKLYALIISELRAYNEIVYLEPSDSFVIETNNGLTSFSDKKYLKKNRNIILGYSKNFTQIFIPVASLVVAVLALWTKIQSENNIYNDSRKEIELRLERLEKLQNKTEINTDYKKGDTLKVQPP